MGLLNDKVEVTLGGSNIKYYESLGYTIPYVVKDYKTTVPWGSSIIVDIKDLSEGANISVPVKCDCCGSTGEIMYAKYLKNIKRNDGKYICKDKTTHYKMKVGTDFEELKQSIITFLNKNNRFPKFTEYLPENGFKINYERARKVCKANGTTLNVILSDIDCFKVTIPNVKHYTDYLNRLKEYIEIEPNIALDLHYYLAYNAPDLPKFKWFIDNCPDKTVCDTDTFKKWAGLFPNVMDKETCISQILKMQQKLDRPLMYDDFRNREYGKPTIDLIRKYWGSVNKMKKALGLEVIQESMTDRHLYKEEFVLHINKLANYIKSQGRDFITTYEIDANTEFLNSGSLRRLSKLYFGKTLPQMLEVYNVRLGKEGNGILFNFDDGEHTTSQFEYMFSKFLKDYGLVYNKDYFRDVRYSTFIDGYKKQMNCDYVIHYKGKTIYVEIAGILGDYKSYYYRNQVIDKSKSKEKYRLKLKEKEDMLKKQGLTYFFLFRCDMTKENFNAILEDSSLELKHNIEKFIRNNIDWKKVRQNGELKYTDRIVRTNREIDYGEAI